MLFDREHDARAAFIVGVRPVIVTKQKTFFGITAVSNRLRIDNILEATALNDGSLNSIVDQVSVIHIHV